MAAVNTRRYYATPDDLTCNTSESGTSNSYVKDMSIKHRMTTIELHALAVKFPNLEKLTICDEVDIIADDEFMQEIREWKLFSVISKSEMIDRVCAVFKQLRLAHDRVSKFEVKRIGIIPAKRNRKPTMKMTKCK